VSLVGSAWLSWETLSNTRHDITEMHTTYTTHMQKQRDILREQVDMALEHLTLYAFKVRTGSFFASFFTTTFFYLKREADHGC